MVRNNILEALMRQMLSFVPMTTRVAVSQLGYPEKLGFYLPAKILDL